MIDGLILAFQFLTRIPMNKNIDFSPKNLKTALYFFPIIGLVIGVLTAMPFILVPFTEFRISALLSLIIYIFITGGLHLDGLSDTVDGFYSGKSREDIIRIMKDSRIGAFGVIALIIALLAKYTLYISLASYPALIVIATVNSRFSAIHLINNYRSPGYGGIADCFRKGRIGIGELFLIIGYLITLLIYNKKFLISFVFMLLFTRLIAYKSQKCIGAVSGDVIGASIEISDIISLIILWGTIIWI